MWKTLEIAMFLRRSQFRSLRITCQCLATVEIDSKLYWRHFTALMITSFDTSVYLYVLVALTSGLYSIVSKMVNNWRTPNKYWIRAVVIWKKEHSGDRLMEDERHQMKSEIYYVLNGFLTAGFSTNLVVLLLQFHGLTIVTVLHVVSQTRIDSW